MASYPLPKVTSAHVSSLISGPSPFVPLHHEHSAAEAKDVGVLPTMRGGGNNHGQYKQTVSVTGSQSAERAIWGCAECAKKPNMGDGTLAFPLVGFRSHVSLRACCHPQLLTILHFSDCDVVPALCGSWPCWAFLRGHIVGRSKTPSKGIS